MLVRKSMFTETKITKRILSSIKTSVSYSLEK